MACGTSSTNFPSPAGSEATALGINLAIQDAVAASNILAPVLRAGPPTNDDLARVQRRREFPARATQHIQVMFQNKVIDPVLRGEVARPPLAMRLIGKCPPLQRLAGRLIGVGVRPEHVRSPQA